MKNVASSESKSDAEFDEHQETVRQLRRVNKALIIERFDLQAQLKNQQNHTHII